MSCNQNCNQGRACDCTDDLPIQYAAPEYDDEPNWTLGEIASVAVFAGALISIGFMIGRFTA